MNEAAFKQAVELWTLVLEISVAMAQFPSKESRGYHTSTEP